MPTRDQIFVDIALNSPQSMKGIAGLANASVNKGSIIQFRYQFAKPGHDQNPLILITDNMPNYLRGVNMHYLGINNIMKLIGVNRMNACGNTSFSYESIKSDEYIKKAFRMYKKTGVARPKVLDCAFLKRILVASQKLNPQDLTAIRSNIIDQLQRVINQTAEEFIG
jgi:hypothetical protein